MRYFHADGTINTFFAEHVELAFLEDVWRNHGAGLQQAAVVLQLKFRCLGGTSLSQEP